MNLICVERTLLSAAFDLGVGDEIQMQNQDQKADKSVRSTQKWLQPRLGICGQIWRPRRQHLWIRLDLLHQHVNRFFELRPR
jgi:hypothetical protein